MEKMRIKSEKIMRLASQRGLSLREISQSADVAFSSLTAWLRGTRNPKPANIFSIAQALGVQVAEIADLGREDTMQVTPPRIPDTIQNTPELRECIKDAMMSHNITDAVGLKRALGYDSSNTLDRLLTGKLNFFPDMLSAIFDALDIKHDDAPITPEERQLLHPEGIFNAGAILTRPMPVIDWANAASHFGMMQNAGNAVLHKWDPDSTETVPAPIGLRKETLAFRIYGESMEPTINDEEIIFCSKTYDLGEINTDDIVVVHFSDDYNNCPGCVVCKRYRKVKDLILLTSDNRSSSSRNFDNVYAKDIAWIGIVVSKVTNFRRL